MISFATLLLGLVAGLQTIELSVDPAVTRVELVLDQRVVAELVEAPWVAEIDLGSAMEPHRLEAVAYGAAGGELERITQWLNVPRPPSEISLHLEQSPDGRGSLLDVHWMTVLGLEPVAWTATLDAKPLQLNRLQQVPLPDYDPNLLHYLEVEVEFDEINSARAELTFGGVYAEEVSSELTALAVSRAAPLRSKPAAGTVLLHGAPVSPRSVETGDAEFVVVRDQSVRTSLERLFGARRRTRVAYSELGKDEKLRLVGTVPRLRQGPKGQSWLFPITPEIEATDGQLTGYLTYAAWLDADEDRQSLIEATAIAGLTAVELNRRRVLVVLLGKPSSQLLGKPVEDLRRFLKLLGVPLRVWTTYPQSWSEQNHSWGEIEDVSRPSRLQRAVRRARRELESQSLLWFEGRALTREFSLGADADFEIAG